MRLKVWNSLFVCIVLASSLLAQDLGQLKTRVTSLWEARARMNKTEALKFVEPQSHNVFLQLNDTPIASFKILGIEFQDEPNQVRVSVKVNGVVPGVGSERVVTDTWVWKGGVWMLRASATPVLTTMFENDASKRPSAPVRPDFQLAETVIDIGKHAQGDVVDGKIAFKGLRRDILVVRSKDR